MRVQKKKKKKTLFLNLVEEKKKRDEKKKKKKKNHCESQGGIIALPDGKNNQAALIQHMTGMAASAPFHIHYPSPPT